MKKIVPVFLVLCVFFSLVLLPVQGNVVAGNGKVTKDPRLAVPSEAVAALFEHEVIPTPITPSVTLLMFVNIHSDTGYFMVDDLANSQWVENSAVTATAMDVTGAEEDVLALYREGFDQNAVRLTGEPEDLSATLAQELGITDLSYPFTVILDAEHTIRYALEGYRAPDLLATYVRSCIETLPAPQSPTAVATESGEITLSWSSSSLANGYEIWRAPDNTDDYEKIFTAVSGTQNSYRDTALTNGMGYRYQIRTYVVAESGFVYSEFTDPLSVAALATPSLPLRFADGYLHWEQVPSAISYTVYRFASEHGALEEQFTVAGDEALQVPRITGCLYVVRPVYGRG